MTKKILLAAAFSIAACGAQAASIVNGSFEDGIEDIGTFVTLGNGSDGIDGWSIYSENGGSIDYIGSYWNASDGNRSVDLLGNGELAQLYQKVETVIGQAYRISFDLSGNTDGGPTIKTTQVGGGIGTTISFQSSSATPIPNLTWSTYSFVFQATTDLTTLIFESEDTGAYGAALDNVSIEAVPVPAAGFLLLGGLGALGALRRRKKAA